MNRSRKTLRLLAMLSTAAAPLAPTAIIGGTLLAPSVALAANECAPVGTSPGANGAAPDSFTCTTNYTSTGVTYSSAGDLTVSFTGMNLARNVGATGVNLVGNGSDAVTFNSSVGIRATSGPAIDIRTGAGLLTINMDTNNGSFGASSTGSPGIYVNAGGDAVINLGLGSVRGNSAPTAMDLTAAGNITFSNRARIGSGSQLTAMIVSGGGFTLNNSGEIVGRINTAGVTGAVVINNEVAGLWRAQGEVVFGAQSEINNNGRFVAHDFSSSSPPPTTTLTGLAAFNNSGRIEFGLRRDEADEVLAMPGAAFSASGQSLFLMEAVLGVDGQTSCAGAAVGDCLDLTGGSTSGVTSILLTTVGEATLEANVEDIVLVDVAGGETRAGDFIIDDRTPNYIVDSVYGGVIATDGLLGFALLFDAENQRHYLASVTPSQRLEYIAAANESLSVWHTTSDVVAGRQADLRNGATGEGA